MHLARVLVVLTVFAFCDSAMAETAPDPNEIDKTLQSCLDTAPTDPAQIVCMETAASAWDKILNANYKAASARLDDNNRALLKDAQRKWLHYRDADQAFRDSDWSFGDAFDMKVFLAEAGMQIVKARTQALSLYAD